MASFNNTRIYLNTKRPKHGEAVSIYRVPVPHPNESFYFNQESIKATVYYELGSNATICKKSELASVHLTNKRLIILSQSSSMAPSDTERFFDTCEFQLNDFLSLKSDIRYRKKLGFHIKTIRDKDIRLELKFNDKKAANRRESLREYIKMATSAILAARGRFTGNQQQTRTHQPQDDLPSYLEATTNNGTGVSIAPPAYS
jgi:hypothetical protein